MVAQAAVCFIFLSSVCAAEITPAGRKLAKKLSAMNVERLWQAEHYVNWETGKSISPKDTKDRTFSSHCSAFVAAFCTKNGIPILRPLKANESPKTAPNGLIHSEELLSNAQFDWLKDHGKMHNWTRVDDALSAQHRANRGELVVVTFKAVDKTKPGHIAIVMPWEKTDEEIKKAGSEIIQAGKANYDHTTLQEGFKHHAGAWPNGVRFYAHPLSKP